MSIKEQIKFYVKADCPKIIETAAADIADGIFRIAGIRPETVKTAEFGW